MRADLVLEHRLVMEGHDYTASLTSIFPVTALVIRADRYSRRVSIISVDLTMRESIFEHRSSRKRTNMSCSFLGGIGMRSFFNALHVSPPFVLPFSSLISRR